MRLSSFPKQGLGGLSEDGLFGGRAGRVAVVHGLDLALEGLVEDVFVGLGGQLLSSAAAAVGVVCRLHLPVFVQ